MDAKTLLLGVIPPVLAFLAEARNPVSAETIRPQARRDAIQHIAPPVVAAGSGAGNNQAAIDALATTITAIAEAAAEVAGIVPTWISVTAAFAAVLVDLVDIRTCLVVLLVFTLISSLLAIPFFQRVNFRDHSLIAGVRTPFCGSVRRVDCISRMIKGANIGLALLVLGVWYWSPPAAEETIEPHAALAALGGRIDQQDSRLLKLTQEFEQSTRPGADSDVQLRALLTAIAADLAGIRAALVTEASPVPAPGPVGQRPGPKSSRRPLP